MLDMDYQVKIKIVMMVKNEDDLVRPWITYHAFLVGFQNLVIINNGSFTPKTLIAIAWAKSNGALILESYSTLIDFVQRGKIYVDIFSRLHKEHSSEFYIPMDCDEFLAVMTPAGISCDSNQISDELRKYLHSRHPLTIFAGLDNNPSKSGLYRWSLSQRKTFFADDCCNFLDHGFHSGTSKYDLPAVKTNIVYIHYHYKPYDLLLEHSKAKLIPFTEDFSPEALSDYVKQKKEAWHCAAHFLRSKSEYYNMFNDIDCIAIPEFSLRFAELGMELPFSKS